MRTLAGPALLLLALAPPALAQLRPVPGEPPTRGPELPVPSLAGSPEATAVSLNPANLAFLTSWNLDLLYTRLDGQGRRGPGGAGLYLAAPLPVLDTLAAGVALELVRPPDTFLYRDQTKLSFSLAWRAARSFSVGATYAHVFAGDSPGTGGAIDTLDLAATGRLGDHFSIALAVRDVPSPRYQGLGIQRVYQPELAFRPGGTDRVEIAASARIGERRGDVSPLLRISAMIFSGFHLRAAVEAVADPYGTRAGDVDVRATAGVGIDFARVGAAAYALFGSGGGGASPFHGVAATLRVSGDRYPAIARRARFERIDLGKGGERRTSVVLAHLRRLERDPKAEGIVAVLGDLDGSWSTMEDLRDAFRRLRDAGKRVLVYGAELTTKSYYVAAAAERVLLDPAGGVRLIGMSSTGMYYRGTGDKLGIRADFVKIAEYKSAPEQYTRTGPTDEARAVKKGSPGTELEFAL